MILYNYKRIIIILHNIIQDFKINFFPILSLTIFHSMNIQWVYFYYFYFYFLIYFKKHFPYFFKYNYSFEKIIIFLKFIINILCTFFTIFKKWWIVIILNANFVKKKLGSKRYLEKHVTICKKKPENDKCLFSLNE